MTTDASGAMQASTISWVIRARFTMGRKDTTAKRKKELQAKLVIKGAMPSLFHVIPISNSAVFDQMSSIYSPERQKPHLLNNTTV